MREGQASTQLIEFTDGFPDGDISWEVLDGSGATTGTGAVTPVAGAVSAVIGVPATANTIAAGLLAEPRELQWSYAVGGLIQRGRLRYRIEAFLPFGISEDGVRKKLGLELEELADEDIDLVAAYTFFRENAGKDPSGNYFVDVAPAASAHAISNGIEAVAGLDILPQLSIRLAISQSSGSDQFQRQDIVWADIKAQLQHLAALGYVAANPIVDFTTNYGSLLTPVVRTPDPVTNT